MLNERKALLWLKAWDLWNIDKALPKGWPRDSNNIELSPREITEAGLTGQELPEPPQH